MGKIVLATGGARSGKSRFAETYLENRFEKVAYLATAIAFDDEMKDRIKKHQAQRPDHWQTFEGYRDLDQVIAEISKQAEACLLDCLTILVTNHMMDAHESVNWDKPSPAAINAVETAILNEVRTLLSEARKQELTLVLVANELGMGLVPEYPMSRAFRDIAGRVNQLVASEADEVYFVVSGIPMCIKGANV